MWWLAEGLVSSDIVFQGIYVILECLSSYGRYPAGRAGFLSDKALFDFYVAGFAQFVYLYTQVSRCRLCLFPQIDEFSLLDRKEDGYHGEPQL